MKKYLSSLGVVAIALLILSTSNAVSQDNSAMGYYYASHSGAWLELEELFAGTRYLGAPERVEIEVTGGGYSGYGNITYYIDFRNGIDIVKMIRNGSVAGHELKIYDTGAENSSNDRYIIGIKISDSAWRSIGVRARELSNRQWLNIVNATEPTLPQVSIQIDDKGTVNQNINGNVGIGTDAPSEKLTVSGTIKAKEIIVDENTGADFVFRKDYALPSLSEVERFIKKNGHLAEIPSAEEMKKNGIRVGDLQMKLLQKVEELTLYSIKQKKEYDKRFKEQQKRIKKLKTLLDKRKKTKFNDSHE